MSTAPSPSRRPGRPAGHARAGILDAAVALIRRHGLSRTSIDQICAEAGVTKGAFFHHFRSKDALAIAAAEHWSATTGALFAGADYHGEADPVDRVFGYLALRDQLVAGPPEQFTCLVGTMVQEAFADHPDVRDACGASILGHAATLEGDIAAALAANGAPADLDAAALARFTQVVLQGAFVVAKAADDDAVVHDAIAHLRRYFISLIGEPPPSPRSGTSAPRRTASTRRKATN